MEQGIQKGMEQGIQKGMEQGIQRGEELGEEKERIKNIRAFREILPAEKIAETLQLPLEYVLQVMEDGAKYTTRKE